MTPEALANARKQLEALSEGSSPAEGETTSEKSSPSEGETPKKKSGFAEFMEGLNEAFKVAKPVLGYGGLPFSDPEAMLAAGTAAADAAVGGSGAALATGMQAQPGLAGLLLGGANAASNVINRGEPFLNDEKMQEAIKKPQEGHPYASLAGTVAGSLAPAFVAPEATLPMLPRAAATVGLGTAGGAATDRAAGGSGKEGALIGGILGGAGAGISEVGVPIVRSLLNTDPGRRATNAIREAATTMRGSREFPTDRLQAELARLGPGATIADLPEMAGLAKSVMYDPKLQRETGALAETMNARVDEVGNPGRTLQAEFRENVEQLYPGFIDRAGHNMDNPRTDELIRRDIRAQKAALVPQYAEVLGAVSTAHIRRPYLRDMINHVFSAVDAHGVPIAPSDGNRKAMTYLNRRLDDLALSKVDRVTADNWRREVSRARTMGIEPPVAPGFINPRDLQTLRLDLKKPIATALKSGERHTAESLIAFNRGITNNILNEVPGYRALNQAARSEEGYLEASNLGRSVFNMKPEDLSNLPHRLMELPEAGDRAGFAEGFFNALTNQLSTTSGARKFASKTANDTGFRQALELIMPGQGETFARRLGVEMQLGDNAAELMGGRGRAGASTQGAIDRARRRFIAGRLIGFVWSKMTGQTLVSSASASGAVEQAVRSTGIGTKTAVPMTQMLNAQGQEAQSMLGQIGAGQVPPGLTQPTLMDSILQSRLSQNPLIWGAGGGIVGGQRERAER